MPKLRDAIIEKYTRTRAESILQYAKVHCPEAYFALLRAFDPARCQAECQHEQQDYHAETGLLECLTCGKLEALPMPNQFGTIFMMESFDYMPEIESFKKWYFGKNGKNTKEGDVWIS